MTAPPSNAAGLSSVAVLIPAWKPDAAIVPLVRDLMAHGFAAVVVVNDGSGPASRAIFDQLAQQGARVLHHAVNLGKGRALKTGFNWMLNEAANLRAVATVDADGQHPPADTVAVCEAWLAGDGRSALGARAFDRDVPLRSRLGNYCTRLIFGLVSGTQLRDTQTGLRVLPLSLLPSLMTLEGERYEFEMSMLAFLCREGARPLEVPIQTVYIDGNRSSHFNPLRDSMRIYFVLARFYLSALVAAGVDFLGFSMAYAVTHHLLISVAIGRFSSLVNFAINRGWVFHNRGSLTAALWRYYALAIGVAGLSYGALFLLATQLHWNVFLAKVIADTCLSLVSFSVQRTFIFRRKAEAGATL